MRNSYLLKVNCYSKYIFLNAMLNVTCAGKKVNNKLHYSSLQMTMKANIYINQTCKQLQGQRRVLWIWDKNETKANQTKTNPSQTNLLSKYETSKQLPQPSRPATGKHLSIQRVFRGWGVVGFRFGCGFGFKNWTEQRRVAACANCANKQLKCHNDCRCTRVRKSKNHEKSVNTLNPKGAHCLRMEGARSSNRRVVANKKHFPLPLHIVFIQKRILQPRGENDGNSNGDGNGDGD